jgi:LEA14-like dessication related protein
MKICRYGCILVVLLIMAIFTMTEGSRKIQIGYDITRMENELVRLSEESKKLKFVSIKLRKPDKISLKVKNMELDLSVQEDEDIAVAKESHKHLEKELGDKIEA